jgi:hypothetical protein
MRLARALFWTPRLLGILLTVWISIFALDVFGQGYGFWGTMAALVVHFVPAIIVLTALVIAWRWASGPLFLIGCLGHTDVVSERVRHWDGSPPGSAPRHLACHRR